MSRGCPAAISSRQDTGPSARNTDTVVSVTATRPKEQIIRQSTPVKKRNGIRDFLEMIKFEHTLFALPFAYTGAFLAGSGHLPLSKFLLITLAMVTARTAAMSLNRILDKKWDALNPRTAARALPAGILSEKTAWTAAAIALTLFLLAAGLLNQLSFFLAPVATVILIGYSYLKRFTWLCHLGLGLVLACAPIGGWVAVAGHLSGVPLVLGAAMLFWLAGFDTLYGCLDVEFDRTHGLHSIPQRFGVTKALWLSSLFHLVTFVLLGAVGILSHMNWPYDVGLILVALILIYEHLVVTPRDLSRINQAFFQANAAISLVLFFATLVSFWIGP